MHITEIKSIRSHLEKLIKDAHGTRDMAVQCAKDKKSELDRWGPNPKRQAVYEWELTKEAHFEQLAIKLQHALEAYGEDLELLPLCPSEW